MDLISLGNKIPNFKLIDESGKDFYIESLLDKNLLITFFQEAGTPTCNRQLETFAQEKELFETNRVSVLAVSVDSPEINQELKQALKINYPIASDSQGQLAKTLGVFNEKTYRAKRSVFVLDSKGIIKYSNLCYSPKSIPDLLAIAEAVEVLGNEI